jgi:hypothetical protein
LNSISVPSSSFSSFCRNLFCELSITVLIVVLWKKQVYRA